MTTAVSIVADSRAPTGSRLTTFECVMPRIILPEITRHRVMSFSVQSSRAVPVSKLIASVREDPFVPQVFTQNIRGMSGGEPLEDQGAAKMAWITAARHACDQAEALHQMGAAKEHVNRLLEPFAYVAAVISATEWDNFFDLRISENAQPEIRELAVMMKSAMVDRTPIDLAYSQWHSPYAFDNFISAARCARVSYKTRDERYPHTPEEDRALSERLVADEHWSPFEHQARPALWPDSKMGRNFGSWWVQNRAVLDGPH